MHILIDGVPVEDKNWILDQNGDTGFAIPSYKTKKNKNIVIKQERTPPILSKGMIWQLQKNGERKIET